MIAATGPSHPPPGGQDARGWSNTPPGTVKPNRPIVADRRAGSVRDIEPVRPLPDARLGPAFGAGLNDDASDRGASTGDTTPAAPCPELTRLLAAEVTVRRCAILTRGAHRPPWVAG